MELAEVERLEQECIELSKKHREAKQRYMQAAMDIYEIRKEQSVIRKAAARGRAAIVMAERRERESKQGRRRK